MGTQLIFTVGTNPLPVWVAWYHLRNQLKKPIQVRLVHTADTINEKDRLTSYCHGATFLPPIATSPGDPGTVRKDIQGILPRLDENTHLHIHYTGGTKVMSVESVAGIEYNLPAGVKLETSYLDPRGSSGPAIIDSFGTTLVPDARQGITVDLQHVANLNGFTLAPFVHVYWDQKLGRNVKEDCPEPAILDDSQEKQGGKVLSTMGCSPAGRFSPTHFEYATYVALKDALEKIKASNANRDNYQLFHSVHVRRTGSKQHDKHFELDVVAILGYQIVVVSCTLANEQDRIKQKGMEAILRARQLGGDEAQAIVLCRADRVNTQRLEKELHNEVGSAGTPLQIWGQNKWRSLSDAFHRYLRNDLQWR